MTDEKKILIKDLCGRLPYNPMVHVENSVTGVSCDQVLNPLHITMLTESDVVTIKPYLRHGFDTKEERQEYSKIDDVVEAMDYMLAKHIDCRNMIEEGSALEAPEGMYKNNGFNGDDIRFLSDKIFAIDDLIGNDKYIIPKI